MMVPGIEQNHHVKAIPLIGKAAELLEGVYCKDYSPFSGFKDFFGPPSQWTWSCRTKPARVLAIVLPYPLEYGTSKLIN
jgi:hypothetical protein